MNSHNLTIPHDFEAEQSVLGAIILDNDLIDSLSEIITPNSFHAETHRHIFRSALELRSKSTPIDEITLGDELRSVGKLDDIGGYGYLAEIVEATPTSGNAEYYAKIIQEDALLRDLISVTSELGRKGRDPLQSLDDLLAEAYDKISEMCTRSLHKPYRHVKEILKDNFDDLEKRSEGATVLTGIPTGFTDIDRITLGLQPSDLIILAARPSMGKTALALNIADYAATRTDVKGAVLIFSLEMADVQLTGRLLSGESKINSRKLRTGKLSQEDWDKMVPATERISKAQIYINQTPGITPSKMAAIARRLDKEHVHGVALIIIDYIGLMESDKKTNSREQEVSQISRSLKGMAKQLDVPVLALSQLNRALENRSDKRPKCSDLRDSGSLEQDADIIMFIYRDEVYNEDTSKKGEAEILIEKHRNGPLGVVELMFDGKCTSFYNKTKYDSDRF